MAWLGKGSILFAQKKYTESIEALDMGIQLNPDDIAEAWKGKGMALDVWENMKKQFWHMMKQENSD
jgi:hypothetical protein